MQALNTVLAETGGFRQACEEPWRGHTAPRVSSPWVRSPSPLSPALPSNPFPCQLHLWQKQLDMGPQNPGSFLALPPADPVILNESLPPL